jgi:hypothetical protein
MAKRVSNTRPSTVSQRPVSVAASHLSATKTALSDPITVAAILTACAAVGAITYGWGKDVGQAELKTRQDLASMNLPKIAEDTRASTADLRIVSGAFKDMLVNNATYQEMKSQYDQQQAAIADLTSQIRALTNKSQDDQKKITSLEGRLSVFENPDKVYSLERGMSQQTSDGELIVGMQRYMLGFAEITVNGKRESAQAGSIVEAEGLKGGNCLLKMLSVSSDDTATFSAKCAPAKN